MCQMYEKTKQTKRLLYFGHTDDNLSLVCPTKRLTDFVTKSSTVNDPSKERSCLNSGINRGTN